MPLDYFVWVCRSATRTVIIDTGFDLVEGAKREREVFLLRQNGDLTYERIARLLNVPVGTTKTRMRAALRRLRTVLDPQPGAALS